LEEWPDPSRQFHLRPNSALLKDVSRLSFHGVDGSASFPGNPDERKPAVRGEGDRRLRWRQSELAAKSFEAVARYCGRAEQEEAGGSLDTHDANAQQSGRPRYVEGYSIHVAVQYARQVGCVPWIREMQAGTPQLDRTRALQ
jgi:hypothetical protein